MVYMFVAQCFLLVHLLGFVPTVFESPQPFLLILRLLDVGLLAAVWVFVLSLFQRDFKIQNIHLSLGLFVSAIMLAERLVQYGYLNALPTWWAHLVNATASSIAVHMVVVTVTGHNDDLLETRRQTRIHMMLLVALAVTLMIVLGSILLPEFQPTIHAISLWPLVFVMGFWVFRLDPAVFAFDTPQGKTPDAMSNKDRIIHGGLMALIVEEKIHLQSNISIQSLAQKLAVGTPALRHHINQNLGFDNFSTFINQYRIEAIKLALENKDNDHIPVLTLALNHGFNSLPPFNRAFKKMVGQTPTEYRKNRLK